MAFTRFKLPTEAAMKNKTISAVCLFLIIISLYSTCYLLFFRTTGIDVTKDIEVRYKGENGTATVTVRNKNLNYNQRIQEFMDTVTYQIKPDKNLKNGDTIKIKASYDETLASRYHINPDHLSKEVVVSNLPIRYENAKSIPQTLLDMINESSQSYLEKNMENILNDDFTNFYVTSNAELEGYKRMYRVFLNSKSDAAKDKMLDIYVISANGEVNTSNTEEKLQRKTENIYYMITYNEVNTSNKIAKENIYGEKIITQSKQDLSKEKDFTTYIEKKYQSTYAIERIE